MKSKILLSRHDPRVLRVEDERHRKADGTAHGEHLLRATVRPTLEVILTESPVHLRRQLDPDAGIPLVRL